MSRKIISFLLAIVGLILVFHDDAVESFQPAAAKANRRTVSSSQLQPPKIQLSDYDTKRRSHNDIEKSIFPSQLFQTVSAESNSVADRPENEAEKRARRAQKVKEDALHYPPIILDPFPQAADPNYINNGPVGLGDFILSREGGPTLEELSNENLYRILVRRSNVTDLEVNTLVWKCLGYRFDPESKEWTARDVFPKWKERFPTPPDLIGMQRIYSKAVDGPCLKNNQHLVRSIPADNKQSLKEQLQPLGFTGYKVSELTPNLTRRAQCSNWLLYYREELFGLTLGELQEKRQRKKETEEKALAESGEEKKWSPPVKEVY
jgi:Domain of unknown function (DUF1823)